ncbi:MAG: hypothetical protein EZS28_014214 [Streblomastix strix]|uniref:Uncharacterized protein n=1 Tax=Streblomastix strix TaxID=222440 RepID=A0A5J4W5U2_9EUKA|nr:MAG: hypothetical protein EZS28_014214 [Streblomastix strix]
MHRLLAKADMKNLKIPIEKALALKHRYVQTNSVLIKIRKQKTKLIFGQDFEDETVLTLLKTPKYQDRNKGKLQDKWQFKFLKTYPTFIRYADRIIDLKRNLATTLSQQVIHYVIPQWKEVNINCKDERCFKQLIVNYKTYKYIHATGKSY